MKRGSTVYIKRPKNLLRAELVQEYDHYPAVRVKLQGEEHIVRPEEVLTEADVERIRLEHKRAEAITTLQPLIDCWKNRICSLNAIAEKCGWNVLVTYNRLKQAKRLGLI